VYEVVMKVCRAGVNDMEASNITMTVLQQSSSKEMRVFGGQLWTAPQSSREMAVSLNNLFAGAPIDYIYPLLH
jgi:hypothetical protein